MSEGQKRIERLEEAARGREAAFLEGLAQRLNRPQVTEAPQHPFRGAPAFWQAYQLGDEERVALFMQNWTSLGGVVKRVASLEEAGAFVASVVEEMGAKHLIRWDHPLLAGLGVEARAPEAEMTVWSSEAQSEEVLAKAAGADIGLVVAEAAIAHTGTLCTLSGATLGRSVSLLPTAMMAVVRAQDIRTRMGEVMEGLHRRFGQQLPAGVHFITGPSRSADIENDLTIGVHGPGIVYALIIE